MTKLRVLAVNLHLIITVTSFILAVSLFTNGYFIFFGLKSQSNGQQSNSVLRALLIDALYASLPNEGFTKSVSETLSGRGYRMDVFKGKEVTVDLLENLENGYSLIILRMHSALSRNGELNLFTSEPYSVLKYIEEQIFQMVGAAVSGNETHPIFTINHKFIEKYMQEKLAGAIVFVTGCETAQDAEIIATFIDNGAKAYIGWNGPVLLDHSDRAIEVLIGNIYEKNLSLEDALENTNLQVGKDPFFGTELNIYLPTYN